MTISVNAEVLLTLKRRMNNRWTPDLLTLKKHPCFIVMDYGDLMFGGPSNDFLGDSPFLGVGTTVIEDFSMSDYNGKIVGLKDKRREYRGCLRGEAYLVTLPTLMKLDTCFLNTERFQRQPIMVQLDDQKNRAPGPFCTRAFVYLGVEHYWSDKDSALCNSFYEQNKKVYEW